MTLYSEFKYTLTGYKNRQKNHKRHYQQWIQKEKKGGKSDAKVLHTCCRFDMTVASEVMAILALTNDLRDMRERLGG
jgi:formyltetrahydrofolate synthetase